MAVKRIIANIRADRLEDARRFYADILDMDVVMDHGWIVTYASDGQMAPQISIACEGGAGTPVPDLPLALSNLPEVHPRAFPSGPALEHRPLPPARRARLFLPPDPLRLPATRPCHA